MCFTSFSAQLGRRVLLKMGSAQVTLYGREREAIHTDIKNPGVQGSVPKWTGLGSSFVRHFEFLWNERHNTKAQSLDSQSDCKAEINQKKL